MTAPVTRESISLLRRFVNFFAHGAGNWGRRERPAEKPLEGKPPSAPSGHLPQTNPKKNFVFFWGPRGRQGRQRMLTLQNGKARRICRDDRKGKTKERPQGAFFRSGALGKADEKRLWNVFGNGGMRERGYSSSFFSSEAAAAAFFFSILAFCFSSFFISLVTTLAASI